MKNLFSANNDIKFQSIDAVLIFIVFFIVLVSITATKKIFYYFKFKKRYYIFPRPSIQGIANIAMVTALSVAVLLLLTFITSNAFSVLFRAFPGSRVTIEGILIKIGGLLFGPFIGMFIGALTDLLSIVMTAGIFHYGYFIAALGYGLLSGLIKSVYSYSSKNKFMFAILATIVICLCSAFAISFTYIFNPNGVHQTIIPIVIPEVIEPQAIVFTFIGFSTLIIGIIWFLFLFSKRMQEKRLKMSLNSKHFNKKQIKKIDNDYFINFCLVLICSTVAEIIVNVILMPAFDADLSTLGYDNWFTIRLLLCCPMIVFNFFIIYPVYTIVWPLVKWDYKQELVEDYSLPFYVE